MYEFSTMLPARCANSSGYPILPIGVSARSDFFTFSGIMSDIGDHMIPGAIAATLIPYLPKSRAIGMVMPFNAALLAE